MCYSVINPCGYWTSGTLSVLVSNGNTLYNVMGVRRHASWSSWKWEYQWSSDKPYCLRCKQWCTMLQFGWEQICVEDVHFKTLSWSDRIFVTDWNILYKLCIVVQQRSRVKDFFFSCGIWWKLGEIRLVQSVKSIQSLVEEICKIT